MGNQEKKKIIIWLSIAYLAVLLICMTLSIRYVSKMTLQSNTNIALDVADLIGNNYEITDDEVAYMKSLSFNEMEIDPINLRLMNICNGIVLQSKITNVYVVAPLKEDEIKYNTDEANAEQFGCNPGTPLDAIWLLNGIFDDNGQFVAKQRDDIYRYTVCVEEYQKGFEQKEKYGAYSSDQWGEFITGYIPLYTVEGNYVGMLGVDMDTDSYQRNIVSTVLYLVLAFILSTFFLLVLFLFLYSKYEKVKENKIYFDFYSKMSHDMRTPMNGIMGMADLASQENDVTVLHDYFCKVAESGHYLLQLINDTLDVGKISSGKLSLHKENVRCGDIFENVSDMVQLSAKQKNITYTVEQNIDENIIINTDGVRVKQIFVNLLTNALKYTKPGGRVSFIQNGSIEGNELHCQFVVEDTGVGMSDEYIKHFIYQPFTQESSSMSDFYTGSGLGLSITKSLVDMMGGKIQVKSEIGEGTSFAIQLVFPIGRKDEMEPHYSNTDEQTNMILQQKKILLCEDHPLNAEIAMKLLEKKGCSVEVAENGQVGVDKFKQSRVKYYDVILMDIRMPVMDGLEATKRIRELNREDAIKVPIIAMTANAYAEDIENSKNAGINEHLSKPIMPEQLYTTIAKLLVKKL